MTNPTVRKDREPAKRRKPIRKRNPQRKKREFARAYNSKEYVAWIRKRPCAACGAIGHSECAHVGRFSGMGRKGDWRETVPLCGLRSGFIVGCHRVLHDIGRASFEREYGISLALEAFKVQQAWSEYHGLSHLEELKK